MGAILVHIDLDGDRLDRSSLSAVAAGRAVASSWGATLYAAVIGADRSVGERHRAALARAGADKVVVATTTAPLVPLWATVGDAWQAVIDRLRPRLVLFGADSPSGSELGPRTAARLGARLLVRARAVGTDDVELRDRDGGYVRSSESGAAVVLVGGTHVVTGAEGAIDLIVIIDPGGEDPRIELVSNAAAEVAHSVGTLIVIDDEAAGDPAITKEVTKLAKLFDATVVGSAQAARGGAIASGAAIERNAPLSPELCIAIGLPPLELAGATSLVRIGSTGGKNVDGALPATQLAELRRALEDG